MKDKTCEAINNDPEHIANMEMLQEQDDYALGELGESLWEEER